MRSHLKPQTHSVREMLLPALALVTVFLLIAIGGGVDG